MSRVRVEEGEGWEKGEGVSHPPQHSMFSEPLLWLQ